MAAITAQRGVAVRDDRAAIIAAGAIAVGISLYDKPGGSAGPLPVQLPTTPQSYLGVYADGAPASYAGVTAFTNAIGTRPDVVMYYSGWYVPFPVSFATTAANNGAVPLVQMDPDSTKNKIVSSPGSLPDDTTAT